jgi:hypothetical protein
LKYWKRPIRWDLKRRLRGGWGDGCWRFFRLMDMSFFALKYKKQKRKFFWRKRFIRTNYRQFYFFHRFRRQFQTILICYRNYSWYSSNRRVLLMTNLQKLWLSTISSIRQYAYHIQSDSLQPIWRKEGLFTGNLRLIYPNVEVWYLRTKRYWQKLRKRWIWHRRIKRSLSIGYLSYLKGYFAYNIAVRKCFEKIYKKYNDHQKIMDYQVPYFLVQRKLAPVLKQARKLCQRGFINVNGELANRWYMMKPFDIIRFSFRKIEIDRKQWKQEHERKRRKGMRVRRGLIYHRGIKSYIFFKNLNRVPSHTRISYLYNYYYYRNLLQPCRTH